MYATVRRFEGVTNLREVARRVNEGLVPLDQPDPWVPGVLLGRCRRGCDGVNQSVRKPGRSRGSQLASSRLGSAAYRHLAPERAADHRR